MVRVQSERYDNHRHVEAPSVLTGRSASGFQTRSFIPLSSQVFPNQDRTFLPDRDEFRRCIDSWERKLEEEAGDRELEGTARRRAVERVLSDYELM